MGSHYAATNIEERLLQAIRAAGLDAEKKIPAESLGALDHFHTGGRRATLELFELAKLRKGERVLDVGAGLAGAARLLASALGCSVVCLEPSADYCAGARLLNRLTGLESQVEVRQGDALEMPFADASFDVVWMQNVGMSIPDKPRLYAAVRRVLKRDGRFVFQEMAAGDAPLAYFPVPWALSESGNHLASMDEMRSHIEKGGFAVELFEDTSEAELRKPPSGAGQSSLTLSVYVDNLVEKSKNTRRNLQEKRVRMVRGVFLAR